MTADKSEDLEMLEPGKPPPKKKARKEHNHDKMTATTERMEQHIWKEFPEDLFEAVIARLPITTIFRFRAVCQKWNSLPTSKSFALQCTQVKQTQPWFYTITWENAKAGATYDPSLRKWHHLSLFTTPTKVIPLPVASAGGLICFIDVGRRSLYVCNPLTRSFKELPARSDKVWPFRGVGMTLNRNSSNSGYKILRVSCEGKYEVYDSTTNSWTQPKSLPSNIILPRVHNYRPRAVSIDETLYFMHLDPDGLLSYNMGSGIWEQIVVPFPPHVSDHMLAECGGRIMLVGLLTKNAATCVCIWELQKMTLLWKEVDRMPNEWCLEFYGKHVRMSCWGNKDMLMLSLNAGQMNRLVTYDLASREWVKVPGCVTPHGTKRQFIVCGVAFYPCFTALA